jgi:hypothetical protein
MGVWPHNRPLSLNTEANRLTTASELLRSCAQNRNTRQPARRSCRETRWSRCLFRFSFRSQKLRFPSGVRPCFGQACQKHPSTNTARRSRRKTKSGVPGNRWCRRQPLIPLVRSIDASFSSVSLLPLDRIAAITCERFSFEKMSAICFRRDISHAGCVLKGQSAGSAGPPMISFTLALKSISFESCASRVRNRSNGGRPSKAREGAGVLLGLVAGLFHDCVPGTGPADAVAELLRLRPSFAGILPERVGSSESKIRGAGAAIFR